MDRLKAMSILVQVVDSGSFSAASRTLGIPLATVSRQVTELETHLGTRLLTRTTRKLALTDAGIAYLASARRVLEDIDEAERTAAGEFHTPRGALNLTAPVCFGRLHTLPVVRDFLAAYPQISVGLTLSDRNLHLMEEHIDMAVRIGALPDSAMVATRIGSVRTVLVASPQLLATCSALARLVCATDPRRPTPGGGVASKSYRKTSAGRPAVVELPRPR